MVMWLRLVFRAGRVAIRPSHCTKIFEPIFFISTVEADPSYIKIMRIVRYLSTNGPAHAAYVSTKKLFEIDGDLFGEHNITDKEVTPSKLLAPIDPVYIACIGLNYKQHAVETNSPLPA